MPKLGLGELMKGPGWPTGGDVRKDGRTEGRTDRRTSGNSPLCPTGHRPFGAAAKKAEGNLRLFSKTFSSTKSLRKFLKNSSSKSTTKSSQNPQQPFSIFMKGKAGIGRAGWKQQNMVLAIFMKGTAGIGRAGWKQQNMVQPIFM